jgi:uncharacterized protein (TIGR02266 family)
VLAFKLNFGRASHQREDPVALSNEEANLESVEAKLSAKSKEMEQREEAMFRALEEERQELVALTRSRAGTMASEALSQFPAVKAPRSEPLPEREKANEARRAALEARKHAVEAEQQILAQREESLASAEESILQAKKAVAEIRGKALEIAEAEKALNERSDRAHAAAVALAATKAVERPAATGSDRRRCPRVAMQTEVSLSSETNFYSGFSSDLSDGGLFVATCNVVDRGTEVDVTFTLPTGQTVAAKGVVRWSREFNDATPDIFPGVGIEFTNMPDEQRTAIHAFTAEREPLFWAG